MNSLDNQKPFGVFHKEKKMNLTSIRFWSTVDSFERRYNGHDEFISMYDEAMRLHDAGKTLRAIEYLCQLIDRYEGTK